MTTATILSSYLPQFENFVIEKNKKAEKLFCKQIGYEVSPPFIKRVDGEDYEYVTISIVEETISLDGWSVKGRVDDVAGDIIVSGFSDMTKYRNVSMTRCDHCNVHRSRNHLVVLAKDGEEKVVGSACLRDFVGHTSALQYLTSIGWALNLQETLEEEGMTRGTKQHAMLEINHLLNVAAALVRMYGYVSKARQMRLLKKQRKMLLHRFALTINSILGMIWLRKRTNKLFNLPCLGIPKRLTKILIFIIT